MPNWMSEVAGVMRITVNGDELNLETGATVSDLLPAISVAPERTLISVNKNVLSADEFESTILEEGDSVELFTFVAGG